jgi:predicted SprT family Zn-dependent metalloprotease
MYTPLVHTNEPKIELNNRLWRTAGQCFQDENRIQLATKFFLAKTEYYKHMLNVILPHEIIHQADFNLYGKSEKNCGHGENWCKIMVEYGLKPDIYHSMEILRK